MKNFLVEKIKIVDIIIILGVFLALGVGFFTYKHFRQTASKQVEKTAKIGFQVFLRGITITSGTIPLKVGDNTFISIRNVPYTDLKIVDVKAEPKKLVMPNPTGNPPFILVDDYSQIFMYDVIVTVVDNAQITKDGAVVGGNKIKIGLPITLEGKDYKFNGSVSNVQILPETAAAPAKTEASKPEAQQPKVSTQSSTQPTAAPQAQNLKTTQPPTAPVAVTTIKK